MPRRLLAATAFAAALTLAACAPSPAPSPTTTETDASTPAAAPTPTWTPSDFDEALSAELIDMLAQDQADRLEGDDAGAGSDQTRTERLKEIVRERGWPTYSLVGEEAEDAAWAIAQHSDHDPEFQREALEWLRVAVENNDASPGNLAYLTDRIAVSAGEPQTYGTQVGCDATGPAPATPIADEAEVDERRAEVGLPPLADYYAEMAVICAESG